MGLMGSSYVIGVIVNPYKRFGVYINIISKEDIEYRVTIGEIPHCTCPNFIKMSSQSLRKKGKFVYCKHLYCVF